MRHILKKSPARLETNLLFIQPTRYCGLDCSGCYVKLHRPEEYHTPWQEQLKLFQWFYQSENLWANQISIAIDNLPKNRPQAEHLLNLADGILETLDQDTRLAEDRPEVHVTVNSYHTLHEYINNQVLHWHNLSLISFSNMDTTAGALDTYAYFKYFQVAINYNHMILPERSWDRDIKRLIKLAPYFDTLNLVMPKRPMDQTVTEYDRVVFQEAQDYFKTLKKVDALNGKLALDSCVSTTVSSKRTGFTCGANRTKFTIWPDGRVSGCPYAYAPSGQDRGPGVGKTAADIVAEMFRQRDNEPSDFRSICRLPLLETGKDDALINLRRSSAKKPTI